MSVGTHIYVEMPIYVACLSQPIARQLTHFFTNNTNLFNRIVIFDKKMMFPKFSSAFTKQKYLMCTTSGERRITSIWCQKKCMKSKLNGDLNLYSDYNAHL